MTTGFMEMAWVTDHIQADIHDTDDGLYIPLVYSNEPGQGHVGRWLDSLPTYRRIVFPCVISGRLAGMLQRRGYHIEYEWSEEYQEDVECYVRDGVLS